MIDPREEIMGQVREVFDERERKLEDREERVRAARVELRELRNVIVSVLRDAKMEATAELVANRIDSASALPPTFADLTGKMK